METKTPVTVRTSEKEFTLIQGTRAFLPEVADKSIIINGTLGAPYQFLIGKQKLRKDIDTHLQIFKNLGKLALYIGDQDARCQHVITGALTRDTNFASFRINEESYWSVRDFLKFIRTKKYFFDQPTEQEDLIASLQSFEAKVEKVIKEYNDNSGNSLIQLETKVNEIKMRRAFTLNMAIFQGYDRKVFKVEIGFRPSANSVDLFLISEDLFTTELQYREQLIKEEVDRFAEFNFSKVVVS